MGPWWYMGASKNWDIHPNMDGLYSKTPIKMDDLGVPLFSEIYLHEWLFFLMKKHV